MLAIIPLVIIIIGLGVILVIVGRHISKAAALDVADLPGEREQQLKKSILEHQLLRKFDNAFKKVGKVAVPAVSELANRFTALQKRLRRLEKAYHMQTGSPLPDSNKKTDLRLKEYLETASQNEDEGNLAEAEAGYLSAIKINSHELPAYEGLGRVYVQKKEYGEAREIFVYITKHWPQNDAAYAALAMLDEEAGKLEDAKDHYLHALSINNQVVEYHIRLADLYVRLEDKEKSLSSLQKAQALEPANPKILDQLLDISIIVGNKSLAEEVLDRIKKMNPDHGQIKELEKKVKKLK